MSAPPSTRTNMRLDGNKFQRCQSALSHYRKRPPRPADADIGHASAQVAAHDGVDVLVARVAKILEQSCGLHDLSGLAIAALRCLRLDPGLLQWMLTVRVEPLARRDRRVCHRTQRRD